VEEDNSKEFITCTNCNAKVQSGNFCTECGDHIEKIVINNNLKQSNLIKCPSCDTEISSEKKFCTKCGKSLDVNSNNPNNFTTNYPQFDATLNTLKTSSKDLMKGLGGFLDKTASAIDDNLAQNKSSYNNKDISDRLSKMREKREISPGYLLCNNCNGYYELQAGEKADDFSDECECGGKLSHYNKLPDN
jgi:acetyl-CoA carboxylase beta subunit